MCKSLIPVVVGMVVMEYVHTESKFHHRKSLNFVLATTHEKSHNLVLQNIEKLLLEVRASELGGGMLLWSLLSDYRFSILYSHFRTSKLIMFPCLNSS